MTKRSLALPASLLLATFWAQDAPADSRVVPPADSDPLSWPPISQETRPWSYWWWLGSAVDPTNLTRELERYHDAGWGGVHIIPIYGAKGWEDKYIHYLSPKWMEMLRHTVTEARRFGMGVDMTTGTGWCFGGPNVGDREACSAVVVNTFDLRAGQKLKEKLDRQGTLALVAVSPEGNGIDLTGKIEEDGAVEWTAQGGDWRVYAVAQRPTSRVKRAAPGGEGFMLNPLFDEAIRDYLRRFDEAFAGYSGPKPRAMYHDSFEYGANWSPDLFAQFEKRRGYRLQNELPALFGKEQNDHAARVKSDYRETVSDLMIEGSLPIWVDWSHEHGFLTRNQAHGSPGNLLDLYALADIPETEMFHKDRRPLVAKFASSAAHVVGRKLVAAETGTWLMEHFTETLAELKYLLDDLFLSGVNHAIFHGTCYSPDESGWPGWLFYASTEMHPRNSIWRDVPALADYMARCQGVLQSGSPDNDVLIHWPVHDSWHDASGMLVNFSVHGAAWFEGKPIGKLAQRLWNRGFTFDYVSDRQLAAAKVVTGGVELPGGAYRAVVVPACERVPEKTLAVLLALAEAGAAVIFETRLPGDVPGWGGLEERRAEFKKMLGSLKLVETADGKLKEAKAGKGRVLVGDLETALACAGVAREPMIDHAGLFFIRRSFTGGRQYFIADRGERPVDGWVPLATAARAVAIMDPLSGRAGIGALRAGIAGNAEVFLQLQPGESIILRAFNELDLSGPAWNYLQPAGAPVELAGRWQVKFIEGGPQLPPSLETDKLISWTELGGEEVQRFAGTARYTIAFDAPAKPAEQWLIDLGKVCQSARVRLNGHDLGILFTPPFRAAVKELKPKANVLEIELTNVSANRIRDLDRRRVNWKNFHDINFVNIGYKPFDASNWPLADSGLLGPVQLLPVRVSKVPE
ncbi:MAG: hypothetical protein HY717_10385 [Planctomycetes bacterium]|nr:hypothetical protein [Planctomycetota bacterium]